MAQITKETFTAAGKEALEKIKQIIHEGNVRKIVVTNKDGVTIAQFPLTVGVIGVVLAPVLAAIGAIIALGTECTFTLEKEIPAKKKAATSSSSKKKAQTA